MPIILVPLWSFRNDHCGFGSYTSDFKLSNNFKKSSGVLISSIFAKLVAPPARITAAS